ncbi:MAG: response regulator, partial [Candidatus Dormibacteria bacterium]
MIRILLVDDIAATLDNLEKLLGFEDDIEVCGRATDGRRALDEARRLHPDVILMDVNMPQMDGIEATRLLAEEVPGSPVVIMSVQGDRDYIRHALRAGAREFLIKPFTGDELTGSI